MGARRPRWLRRRRDRARLRAIRATLTALPLDTRIIALLLLRSDRP